MNVPTDISLQVVGSVAAALLVAAVVALIATPVVRSLAFKVGAVDVPRDNRRMHKHPIPRMGGLAIFFGFILSALIFIPLTTPLRGMLLGAVVIVILGIFDDIYALSAKLKFAVQIGAALIAVLMGNQIDYLSNPNIFSSDPYWHLGVLSIPISVLWIVAITNAVNLIDGLDGLACGVSTISSMTMLVIALTVAEAQVAILMAALAGGAGSTMFVENIFSSRYHHVDELSRMGADIQVAGRVAVVNGRRLHGARVRGCDLRGGAALVVAALGAEGTSRISGLKYIRRGYDGLDTALRALGAEITTIL